MSLLGTIGKIGGAIVGGPVGLGIGLAASKIGGELLKNEDQGIPSWMIDDLRKYAADNRTTGYLPDKGLWDADLQATLDEFTAQLGVNTEAFNTDIASRGLYSAGEAPKALYSDVIAPIARAGNQAIVSSKLGYANAYQSGSIAADQLKLNKYQLLTNAYLNKSPSTGNVIGNILSGGADMGIEYLMMKSLLGGGGE